MHFEQIEFLLRLLKCREGNTHIPCVLIRQFAIENADALLRWKRQKTS